MTSTSASIGSDIVVLPPSGSSQQAQVQERGYYDSLPEGAKKVIEYIQSLTLCTLIGAPFSKWAIGKISWPAAFRVSFFYAIIDVTIQEIFSRIINEPSQPLEIEEEENEEILTDLQRIYKQEETFQRIQRPINNLSVREIEIIRSIEPGGSLTLQHYKTLIIYNFALPLIQNLISLYFSAYLLTGYFGLAARAIEFIVDYRGILLKFYPIMNAYSLIIHSSTVDEALKEKTEAATNKVSLQEEKAKLEVKINGANPTDKPQPLDYYAPAELSQLLKMEDKDEFNALTNDQLFTMLSRIPESEKTTEWNNEVAEYTNLISKPRISFYYSGPELVRLLQLEDESKLRGLTDEQLLYMLSCIPESDKKPEWNEALEQYQQKVDALVRDIISLAEINSIIEAYDKASPVVIAEIE